MEASNPDKIMFPEPGFTKADVVGYYNEVAEHMLPMLLERPLTLHRFANGLGSKGFMQKNVAIVAAARAAGVDLDTPFDRFGRKPRP